MTTIHLFLINAIYQMVKTMKATAKDEDDDKLLQTYTNTHTLSHIHLK